MFDQENETRSPQRKKVRLQRTKGRVPFQILTDGQRNTFTSPVLQPIVKKSIINDVSSNSIGGIVKKVQLNNFMCHGNFEIKLNPRINFISGTNGSGKSAIQTAIAVGLGGAASKTNRCSSVNGLIKHGCNAGNITITMTNTGPNAYKAEQYGREIKIVRSLTSTSNSSSYRIYNQWGKLISSKKQELDSILYQFKIYPNNPISILNQDMARNFLSSSKAEHKYDMFKKATLLDEAEAMLSNITTQIKDQRERIDEKELVLKHLDKEIESMNEKMQMIEKLKEAKKRREKLKDELMWAEVYVFREELVKLKDTCDEHEVIKNQFEQKRNELQNEITHKESKINEIQLNLTALQNQCRSREESIRNHRKEYAEKKTQYLEKCDEYQKISNTIKSKKNDRLHLQASLDEIEKEEMEQKSRKEEIYNKIAHLQEILSERNCENKTLREEICRLNNVYAEAEDNRKEKERNITELYYEIKENNERISRMKKFDDLSLYGSWMPNLITRIEEAVKRGKFKKPPRGPLGRYIEVQDRQWTNAIENHLGRPLLTSFFVDNVDDRKQLYEIIRQVKPPSSFGKSPIMNRTQEEFKVHCSRFQEEDRTDILPEFEAKYSKYINLYRALKIKDVVVANFLMDFKSIHQVLLIADKATCRRSMETRQWSSNVKLVINQNADSYLEEGKFYSNMYRTEAKLLQRNVSDHIRLFKEKTAERKKLYREETNEHILIKKNLRITQKEIERLHHESAKCHHEIFQIEREIDKLKNTVEEEMPCLKTKLEELNSLEEEIAELEEHKKIASEDQERLGDEMNQAKSLLNTSSDEGDTAFQSAELHLKLENLKKDIERLQKRIETFDKKIDEQDSQINEIQIRIEIIREQLKEQCIQVSRYSLAAEPLENERRLLQNVKDDLSEIAAFIEEAEKTLGKEGLRFEKEFLEKKMTHTKFKMTLRELKKLHQKYESMGLDRAKTISNKRDLCAGVVFTQFEKVIRSRNYRGKLLFDHKKSTLDILLAPPDSGNNFMNTESLSGGEKSVSTVAFLMALWSNMDLPFYSMDEYDVFMDAINRRTITSLLTSFATAQKSSQFIFLTPLDVSLIQPGPDVAVHRIKKIL